MDNIKKKAFKSIFASGRVGGLSVWGYNGYILKGIRVTILSGNFYIFFEPKLDKFHSGHV